MTKNQLMDFINNEYEAVLKRVVDKSKHRIPTDNMSYAEKCVRKYMKEKGIIIED